MALMFALKQFVDSDVPAHNLYGEKVTEEEWVRIMNEDLADYAKFDDCESGFRARRLNLISRIAAGERTQRLYNQYIELI